MMAFSCLTFKSHDVSLWINCSWICSELPFCWTHTPVIVLQDSFETWSLSVNSDAAHDVLHTDVCSVSLTPQTLKRDFFFSCSRTFSRDATQQVIHQSDWKQLLTQRTWLNQPCWSQHCIISVVLYIQCEAADVRGSSNLWQFSSKNNLNGSLETYFVFLFLSLYKQNNWSLLEEIHCSNQFYLVKVISQQMPWQHKELV